SQFLAMHHRPGNVHDSNGALAFMRECVTAVQRCCPATRIEVRMDSAFFTAPINGIEFGPDDEPRAYWMHGVHPNDAPAYLSLPGRSERVSAEGIVHLFEREEPEQCRGHWFR
ncbi:MAG: capsid protein, partial [Myxococcota bacterium]